MSNTKAILTLAAIGAALYLTAAYTRPHEPAGAWLHHQLDRIPAVEMPHIPFSGLLNWQNDYQSRPTTQPLQTVSPQHAGYTPAELSEIYPTH